MTAIALVAGWTTTGCGVRLADAPPPLPTPDANEAGRAEAVESALAIADLAGAVLATAQDPELQAILEQVEHGSAIQSEALGGLWVPPPRPTPTDATQSPSAGPTGTVDVAQLVTALSDAAAAARTAAVDADATVGRLLVSIAVWRDLAAHVVADAAGTDVAGEDPLAPPALGSGGIDDAALQVSTLGPSSELVRGLDAAAFAYETLAARTQDEAVRATWVERSAVLRRAGETVAVASGAAGTSSDPREGVYDVAKVVSLDPAAAVATIEASLADLWLNTDAPAGVRPAVADAALECYLAALAAGGQLGALDSPSVVLPGLVTPTT